MSLKNIIATITLACLSLSAHAAGAYGTVGFGPTSNWGTGFSLAGGLSNLTQLQLGTQKVPVSAEAGYVNFGSKNYWGWGAKSSAFYGAVAGTFDLQNKLSANVKLGLAFRSYDVCVPGGCVSGTGSGLMFGAGLAYDLGSNLAVGADFRDFDGEGFFGINGTVKF